MFEIRMNSKREPEIVRNFESEHEVNISLTQQKLGESWVVDGSAKNDPVPQN